MQKVLAVIVAAAALAQAQSNPAMKNEVAVLAGAVVARQHLVADIGEVKTDSASPGFLVSYARQVRNGVLGVFLEAPLALAIRGVGFGSSRSSGPDVYFTPGIRIAHPLWGRVAVHGSAGLGVASFTPDYVAYVYAPPGSVLQPTLDPGSLGALLLPGFIPSVRVGVIGFAPGNRKNSLAFGFGGGASIRLTPRFDLRADLRDSVTKSGLGGATGRNHVSFQAGPMFRF